MSKIPVPVPNIGQLFIGADGESQTDYLYYLVIGTDGNLTVWKFVSKDR